MSLLRVNKIEPTMEGGSVEIMGFRFLEKLLGNVKYKGDWAVGAVYSVDDVVIYTDKVYRAKEGHTTSELFDVTKWELVDVTISVNGAQAGDYSKVRVDSTGRVVAGLELDESDIPGLSANKIEYGVLAPQRLGSGTPTSQKYLRGDGSWSDPNEVFGTISQDFIATEGQTTFNLTNFEYSPGSGSIAVYLNGVRMIRGQDYDEFVGTSITFKYGLSVDDRVSVIRGERYTTVTDPVIREQLLADNGSMLIGHGLGKTVSDALNDRVLITDLTNTIDPLKGVGSIGRAIQVVDSIAALRLLSKNSPSKAAFVTGYTTALDGGGGNYRLDSLDTTSADNGGTVIVAADGGRWKLVSKVITPAHFGAAGDGVTDDANAIQAAINSLSSGQSLTINGVFLVGVATGNTSECLKIQTSGVRIIGPGTIKRKNDASAQQYLIRVSAADVTIDGLTIDGSRGDTNISDGVATNTLIRSYDKLRGKIINCKLINSPYQCIDLGGGCSYWEIRGNYCNNFYNTAIQIGPVATDPKPTNYNIISDNRIVGDEPSTSRFSNGIFITSSATSVAHNTHYCDHNVISNNIVIGVADAGIESGYKCRWTVVTGNTVLRSFNAGILIRDNQYTTIGNNTIECRRGHNSSSGHGIYVDGLSMSGDSNPLTDGYIIISGNSIFEPEDGGISVINSLYSSVFGNLLQGGSTSGGEAGINVKTSYSNFFGNTIKRFQQGIRFSLEGNRPMGNVIENNKVQNNIIIDISNGIYFDASSVALAMNHNDISGNRMKNTSSATLTSSTTAGLTFTNTRISDNIRTDNLGLVCSQQSIVDSTIFSSGFVQRGTPSSQFGTVTLTDKYVSGILTIKDNTGEVALFKMSRTGAITTISASTKIGDSVSGLDYRIEDNGSGAYIIKRYSVGASLTSISYRIE